MSKRKVVIQGLQIGGGAPVRVESMLKIPLSRREECLEQCVSLKKVGCELARAAFPSMELLDDLEWLGENSPIPLMADIHFDGALALAALEAGIPSVRINPGNMSISCLRDIVASAREKRTPIRIGANGGSLSNSQIREAGGVRSDALASAVEEQLQILLSEGFYDIILSAKSTSVMETVRANTLLASKYPDFPMHIGITESGYGRDGLVKSAAGLSLMLAQGIGDTLRISLTESPEEEVRAGYSLLRALELRSRGVNIISCPTCGRKRLDVKTILNILEPAFANLPDGLSVAVMGCEVNGPREAMDADFGVAGSASGAVIFQKGQVLKEVTLDELPRVFEEFVRFSRV
ncbi:MAG: (E)-4-hydroxy-3-methylbut-2-enyl-diphosphate synthase [Synergistota bacterium]|nr:(E)-4-hydroxy-3-methylbut-2-enyl-diphosphate synthase [Synergistota bacterium]